MVCYKHDLKKNYLFCLENGCEQRLGCELCYLEDQEHQGHRVILLKEFMENE